MPRTSRAIVRLALAATLAATAVACAGPRSESRRPDSVELAFLGDPSTVMEMLRDDVVSRGGFVHHETAETLSVDFGVRPCVLESGLPGAASDGATERTTEIHVEATYRVRRAEGGSVVTVTQWTTWWHPDLRVWLPLRETGAAGPIAAAQMSRAR